MAAITTHVLDTALGRPAAGVRVSLEVLEGEKWTAVSTGVTDADGRLRTLTEGHPLRRGNYRLVFATGAYNRGFFPEVTITFEVKDPTAHHHVPLLLSPYGYSTYRGS
ncbi:MAG: hydroxyisourate hydrolase [Thermoanaerobaculia bacterium]|nr:hydroxyisourate hydrolase [Thermoanaerobaculia bacterium]